MGRRKSLSGLHQSLRDLGSIVAVARRYNVHRQTVAKRVWSRPELELAYLEGRLLRAERRAQRVRGAVLDFEAELRRKRAELVANYGRLELSEVLEATRALEQESRRRATIRRSQRAADLTVQNLESAIAALRMARDE